RERRELPSSRRYYKGAMKKLILVAALSLVAWTPSQKDVSAWEKQAQNITIVRDDWGIPHVYGKTDADAVFGVMYAQAEDDFNRVNLNQLEAFYGKKVATASAFAASASAAAPLRRDESPLRRDEPPVYKEPGGSNGIAIAPSNTTGHHALLLINPHTSFFF